MRPLICHSCGIFVVYRRHVIICVPVLPTLALIDVPLVPPLPQLLRSAFYFEAQTDLSPRYRHIHSEAKTSHSSDVNCHFRLPREAAPAAGIGSIYEVNRRQSRYIKAPSRLCPLDNEGQSLVSIEITTPLYEKRREDYFRNVLAA